MISATFGFVAVLYFVWAPSGKSSDLCGVGDPRVANTFYGTCQYTYEMNLTGTVSCSKKSEYEIGVTCSETEANITAYGDKNPNALQLFMSCSTPKGRMFNASLYFESRSFTLPTNYTECIFSACFSYNVGGVFFVNKTSCISPLLVTEQAQPTAELIPMTFSSEATVLVSSFIVEISISGFCLFVVFILATASIVIICRFVGLRRRQLRHLSIKHGIPFSHSLNLPDISMSPVELSCKQDTSKSEESLCHSLHDRAVNHFELDDDFQHTCYVSRLGGVSHYAPCYYAQQTPQSLNEDMKYFNQDKVHLSTVTNNGQLSALELESMTLPEFGDKSVVNVSEYMDTDEKLDQDAVNCQSFYPVSHSLISTSYLGSLSDWTKDFDYVPKNDNDELFDDARSAGYIPCDPNTVFTTGRFPSGNRSYIFQEDQQDLCNSSQFSLSNSMDFERAPASMLYLGKDCYDSFHFIVPTEDEQESDSGYIFDCK